MSYVSHLRTVLHLKFLYALWRIAGFLVDVLYSRIERQDSAIIIPSDVGVLNGAKGDEAMLWASREMIKGSASINDIYVGVGTDNARHYAKQNSFLAIELWGGFFMPLIFSQRLFHTKPCVVVIMGADMMDGYYSSVVSLRLIIAADLSARFGAKVSFLGFSFNENPVPQLRAAFARLSKSVAVNLRDPISLARFESFSGRPGRLVADTAFLLKPVKGGSACASAQAWIDEQKRAGRVCIAFNYHPMLYKGENGAHDFSELARRVGEGLARLVGERRISLMLLPHDDRDHAGDIVAQSDLNSRLLELGVQKAHVFLVERPPSAAEIKGLVASLDGVVTGRMHLAIAALGSGVPVQVFGYQGKFHGLFQHFGLSPELIIDPQQALKSDTLLDQFFFFVDGLGDLRTRVGEELPRVKSLAAQTFESLKG